MNHNPNLTPLTNYSYGCRCALCIGPKTACNSAWRLKRTTRPVLEHQHGTRTGYYYGCRCDECTIANTEYTSAYRAKRAA